MNRLSKQHLLLPLLALLVGCYDNGLDDENFYVFSSMTVGDYIDADQNLSAFDSILGRAGMKGLLDTYGNYTCLAPTNEAVDSYIAEHYPGKDIASLDDSTLVAIAKSHIIEEDRKNPLNRFVAYHIMDRNAGYSDLVVSTPDWSVLEGGDYVEYYETMSGELLRAQKVSLLGNEIYMNRCSRENNLMRGCVC